MKDVDAQSASNNRMQRSAACELHMVDSVLCAAPADARR